MELLYGWECGNEENKNKLVEISKEVLIIGYEMSRFSRDIFVHSVTK